MHFTYAEKLSKTELMQGDVLKRTDAINQLLREVHPHFFAHDKNQYFMVLTQSCDLVRRGTSQLCKAPYIAIAPVRKLDVLLNKQLKQIPASSIPATAPIIGLKHKGKMTEFLQRLFNNNESGFFYLEADSTDLESDCVAFLNLSIAIKSDAHFEKCLEAKILQLADNFQSKLGWLVGQLYSRVGTEDYSDQKAKRKVAAILTDAAIWIDEIAIRALEEQAAPRQAEQPQAPMSARQISQAVAKLPNRKKKVLDRAEQILRDHLGEGKGDLAQKLRAQLESDATLVALLK